MSSTSKYTPLKVWGHLKKLQQDILKHKPADGDTEDDRADTLRNLLRESEFILYLVDNDPTKFNKETLDRLYPDGVHKDFESCVKEYGENKMQDYKTCEQLSTQIMDDRLNRTALKLITHLEEGKQDQDDDSDSEPPDDAKEISRKDQKKLEALRDIVKNLPHEVAQLPLSVRNIQTDAFPLIEKYYNSSPPKPKYYRTSFPPSELKKAAKSAGKTEKEVHDECRAYRAWFEGLQKDFQILERQILDKNEMEGHSYEEKIRWQGVIPLMAMGDLWARIKGKSMEQKDFEEAMNRLWLKMQFPKGWTRLPPKNEGDLPTEKELQSAVKEYEKAKKELAALEGKVGINTADESSGANGAATRRPGPEPNATRNAAGPPTSDSNFATYGAATSRPEPETNATRNAAGAPTSNSNFATNGVLSADALTRAMNDLAISLRRNDGSGAFPGNMGQPTAAYSGKRTKHTIEIVSKRSRQIEISEPNTTMFGEPIVAWFKRTRTFRDDESGTVAKNSDTYFIVQKKRDDRSVITEIRSSELCGAQRAIDKLDKKMIPELWDSNTSEELPGRKQIDKINWGIEWLAVRKKINIREGAREVPALVLCLWWLVEPGEMMEFRKGVDLTQEPNERRVVLTRGKFHALMGKERGDLQICNTTEHPQGQAWESVEECIRYYTTEKVLAPPGQLART